MYRIALINMPFANLSLPSIALTQLKSLVESRFCQLSGVGSVPPRSQFDRVAKLRFGRLVLSTDCLSGLT
jgi:hypothetical protein